MTKMYKFSLDPLLHHRRLLEEQQQKELADLEAKRILAERRLAAVDQARRRCDAAPAASSGMALSAGWLQLRVHYLERLRREEQICQQRLAAAVKTVSRKRAELLEIVKSRKILEKLKEKGLHDYQVTTSRKEQAFLNEMAVTRFRR